MPLGNNHLTQQMNHHASQILDLVDKTHCLVAYAMQASIFVKIVDYKHLKRLFNKMMQIKCNNHEDTDVYFIAMETPLLVV